MKKAVKKSEINEEIEESQARFYELGFHLVSDIAEDQALKEFESTKAFIQNEGGIISSEGKPNLINLAYAIDKTVKANKTVYTKAYFSWVKFEVSPEVMASLKMFLDENISVLRYLLINASKVEATPTKPEEAEAVIDEEIDSLVIA